MRSILFVCTANICRSPTAQAVLRRLLARDLALSVDIQSAATHPYHLGKPPFPVAIQEARRRGYDLTNSIARQIGVEDFERFDIILAMDRSNLSALNTIAPTHCKHKLEMLLDYSDKYPGLDVPDPYGGDDKGFERALDMIEDGCKGLARLLRQIYPKR